MVIKLQATFSTEDGEVPESELLKIEYDLKERPTSYSNARACLDVEQAAGSLASDAMSTLIVRARIQARKGGKGKKG